MITRESDNRYYVYSSKLKSISEFHEDLSKIQVDQDLDIDQMFDKVIEYIQENRSVLVIRMNTKDEDDISNIMFKNNEINENVVRLQDYYRQMKDDDDMMEMAINIIKRNFIKE